MIYRTYVLICEGGGCLSSGADKVKEAFISEIKKQGLENEVLVVGTGCVGTCDLGPVVIIHPDGTFYQKLKPEDVPEIVEEHLLKGRVVERLAYKPGEKVVKVEEIDFFKYQQKNVLRNCGVIDPTKIEEYIGADGYKALARALTSMTPEEVIEEVKKSGLRGRGGGGFPTGLKWEYARKEKSDKKYIVCNADEGDPGAFMDRSLLEGDPHSVIEGMAIGAYAIGADQGYIYVRAEYPLAVERVELAIKQAREYGILGKNIFDTDFSFDVEIRVGAGAFVCGEETALIASIEGKRGEPRPRPPFPAQSGLWGKPTVINNVETLANIPLIILKGADWFASIGTEKSKGTKIFALAGDIKNTGLVEVPMGIPLGKIIYEIGGGIPKGRKFKAVQIGGPSGGCIPREYLNVPVDYESLQELGAIMGSGGMIVMDENTCMVDIAKFFLEFVQEESCGKCPPCRIGTKRMLEILTRITEGKGEEGDIEKLIKLGENIKKTALCGLGQTAPNPVLSTIRHFREEYEQHIKYKKCPASVCQALFRSPCQNACPAEVDVPGYIYLISQKKYDKAVALIRERNPFVAVSGRVCNHPCETKCRRQDTDEPLAIRDLKRFAADYLLINNGGYPLPTIKPKNGKKVAVVGSGPAGLTCAYHLARMGYEVTVFEALPVAGGMLAVGIPSYRLPKDILKKEIAEIEKIGVKIKTGIKVGQDVTFDTLFKEGYKAIFVATGAHKDLELGIEGEDMENVMGAVNFLRQANLGKINKVKGRVAVVGGGNAAIDAARTALRLGADEVSIVYRRRREDMPAHPEEIIQAEKEGIRIHFLTNPARLIGENSKVKKMICVRMELGEFDSSGRRRPLPVEGSEFEMRVDYVIRAIGQNPDLSFITDNLNLQVGRNGTLSVNRDNLFTGINGIFAGGDLVSGPSTVIEAIRDGIKAAISIDRYLGGKGIIEEKIREEEGIDKVKPPQENIEVQPRVKKLNRRSAIDIRTFCEVETGYTEEEARKEACRCLRCDLQLE